MSLQDLDRTDRQILAVLRQEGRISNLELAERVGLSPTPCSRRVKRLEESGVIAGYAAKINQAALDQGIDVLINLRLTPQTPDVIETFIAAIDKLPEIKECLLVTGNLDYVLKVRTSDVEALRDFVLTELKSIPGVSETSTMLILDRVKSSD